MSNPDGLKKIERRTLTTSNLRAAEGDEMALIGYACSFNILSQDLGGFREVVAPGAFSASLARGADVRCLFNHDPSQILGRSGAGTLQVFEDNRGLAFRCSLDKNNSDHMNVRASIVRGDISQCSFAFSVPDGGDSWDDQTDETTGMRYARRTLRAVNLIDVSAVTYPAYDSPAATIVQARAKTEASSLLARVLAMPGDWARQEKLARLGQQIAAEK